MPRCLRHTQYIVIRHAKGFSVRRLIEAYLRHAAPTRTAPSIIPAISPGPEDACLRDVGNELLPTVGACARPARDARSPKPPGKILSMSTSSNSRQFDSRDRTTAQSSPCRAGETLTPPRHEPVLR